MIRQRGAFAAPAVFDVMLDRIETMLHPSPRMVMSAMLSARSVSDLDRLLRVVGTQTVQQYPGPRRLQMLDQIAHRRALFAVLAGSGGSSGGDDGDDDDIDGATELQAAVDLLAQTTELLD